MKRSEDLKITALNSSGFLGHGDSTVVKTPCLACHQPQLVLHMLSEHRQEEALSIV